MKKLQLILILSVLISTISCKSAQDNNSTDKDSKKSEVVQDKNVSESDKIVPEHLTYETFKEKVWDFEKNPEEWVYEGDVPCVIDFYATWCRPCKMVAPIMEDLANEYKGKIKIYKIDTDKEKKLAGVFGIRSIPAVLFSPMKGKPMMQTGALPKEEYVKIINTELLNKKQ